MKVRRSLFLAAPLLLATISGAFLVLSPVVARGNSVLRMWGVPDDWSHHHLIFSDPGSFADAVNHGSFESWSKVVTDPRFIFQQEKRAVWPIGIGGGPWRRKPLHNDWTMTLGGGGMVGAGQYPAKYQFGITTASCANDFVVYNTGLAGSSSQPTIIAYSNLYSSCIGSKPSVFWQYNTAYPQGSTTGDGSAIPTSVVLYVNGTQLAFVQNNSSNVASLVLLKWQSGSSLVQMDTGTNNVTPANYQACAAPCMTRLTFSGSARDTNSPPFYDYKADTMYIGDNSGKLHKFNPVFLGTPTEVTTTWPITVSSNVLTGPVYDSGTGHIFVADSGGFLYSYTTAGAAVMKSSQLAATGSKGIVDGPLVDSITEFVYVFVGDDESTNATGTYNCNNATGCNGVFQFAAANSTIGTGVCTPTSATAWSGTNCGKESVFGVGAIGTVIYDGSFDQIYFAGTGTTGNLWTCAATGTPAPKLMQNPMSAFVTAGDLVSKATNVINPLTSAAATCSPVTEIFGSGGTTDDYIFLSVTANGTVADGTTCAGACLYNFLVSTNGTSTTVPTAATAGLAATGGSSGIIMDNISTTGGASQIYFSSLANETCVGNGTTGNGTGGCAVQASQAAP